jgi:ribonuclease H / adenosylcobalamin/alpha-ribazole phosphatase
VSQAGASATAGPARGWRPAQGRATATLLLRHGQTALSVERRFAGRGDPPLTGEGLRQAAAAAGRLAARGGIDQIVTRRCSGRGRPPRRWPGPPARRCRPTTA